MSNRNPRFSEPSINSVLNQQIEGTPWNAFLKEFFSNSGHFFVLKSLSDIALDGWIYYLTHPPEYLLIVAASVQAWYLSRSAAQRFLGNLIGVTIYTLLDLPLDQSNFFSDFSHVIFWASSLAIATCQGLRFHLWRSAATWIIPVESIVRALMLPAFYLVVREGVNHQVPLSVLHQFTYGSSGFFFVSSMTMVGLLLGLQIRHITQQQQELQKTAQLLKNLAEWGIGSYVVNMAVSNPLALELHPCDRTILFMDIRGFTSWCEKTSPDRVAMVLNTYYQKVEPEAASQHPIRITITADEIMAVYATPYQGIEAARRMQHIATEVLSPYELGAGCAVHCGTVIEGLFGSDDVRTYTVIGDVVNTAKRLESHTLAHQITLSDDVYCRVGHHVSVQPLEPIRLKGKRKMLTAWLLV